MKSKKLTELVEITYWSCAIPEHRHKTNPVAEACIAKHSTPKRPIRRWTNQERADACESVIYGESFTAVGKRFDITGQRLRQVVLQTFRWVLHAEFLDENERHNIPRYRDLEDIRGHSEFWLKQLAKLRSR